MPWKRSKIDVVKFEGSTGNSENRIIALMAVNCLVYIATRADGSEFLSKHHGKSFGRAGGLWCSS